MNLRDGYSAVMEAVARAWTVPPRLTVSQWADQHRVLSSKSAAEPGPWRTSRNPLLREPMDALSDHHPAVEVSVMFCSQFGKSEILNNWIGYTIHHAPAPMLVVEPTVETMERYSKQRIEPMIDASDALRERVPSARRRDSGNTVLLKEFPGGILVMGGANSSASLASMPIKKLGKDEIDKYPPSLGHEGSTDKQADQRTITFARRKILNVSTPVRLPLDDDDLAGSLIWRKYRAGSRAQYHVPCPHCGTHQPLIFEHLRWEKEVDQAGRKQHKPETAVYMCQAEGCGQAIEEHHKHRMLAEPADGGTGRWVHERPWLADERPSYWASALYTPIGLGRSWAAIAVEWIEACRDRSKLITFWNLVLGLPYDDQDGRLRDEDIEAQAEAYPLRLVPSGYYIVTASVDVQRDRLEYQAVAWGPGERQVVIDHQRLYGDPERDEVWAELTRTRHTLYPHAGGQMLRVSMTAIDTGGSSTARVYRYCRDHRHDQVMAVKGASQRGQPVLNKPSRKDVKNAKGEFAKHGVVLWMVGTDTAKQALFARLADWAELPVDQAADRMVRLTKQLGRDWFRQLTAEVFDQTAGVWKQIRARNEALDLMVYAHAAAYHPHVRLDRMTTADWAAYQQAFDPVIADLFSAPTATEQPAADGAEAETAEARTTPQPAAAAAVAGAMSTAPEPAAIASPPPQPAPAPVAADPGWLGHHTDDWLD